VGTLKKAQEEDPELKKVSRAIQGRENDGPVGEQAMREAERWCEAQKNHEEKTRQQERAGEGTGNGAASGRTKNR